MGRILVVDDEDGLRAYLGEALAGAGHEVTTAASVDEALARLASQAFHVVLTDLRMPGAGGMAIVRKVRAEQPETEVIVLTAYGSVDTAVEAMKLGAFDYLQKPIAGPGELRLVVARAIERHQLLTARDRAGLEAPPPSLSWGDPTMTPVVDAIRRVAITQATVLLVGESGTGKEVCARAIHAASMRARPVRRHQLRRAVAVAAGERAVRPREGGLHGGTRRQDGAFRAGPRRLAVSR